MRTLISDCDGVRLEINTGKTVLQFPSFWVLTNRSLNSPHVKKPQKNDHGCWKHLTRGEMEGEGAGKGRGHHFPSHRGQRP